MRIFTKDKTLTPSWNLIQPSLKLLQDNIWQSLYLFLLPTLLLTVSFVLIGTNPAQPVPDSQRIAGLLLMLASGLWTLLAYPGFLYMQLRAVEGEDITATEAFKKGLPHLMSFIGVTIAASLLILSGLIFIIPGLLLIRGFYLAPFYVVDKNLGPVEALKQSYSDSQPITAWIWGVIGLEVLFGILSGVFSYIPVIGAIVGIAITAIPLFVGALRYAEVTKDFKPVLADHED